jgi:co-chaperonin GroES (HSP10)
MSTALECPSEEKGLSLIEKEIGLDLEVHGYKVLLKAVTLPEKTKHGFILSEGMIKGETNSYHIGRVLKLGAQAYQPYERFGGKPFVSIGEWVIYSSYERDRHVFNNNLCFFVNDDRIVATVKEKDLIKLIPELERYQ